MCTPELLTLLIWYRYDWLFLRALVTAGYLGWIAFALTTVISHHVVTEGVSRIKYFPAVLYSSFIAVQLASIIFLQQSPWRYYLYSFFPVYFWQEVFVRKDILAKGGKILLAHIKTPAAYVTLAIKTLSYIAALEAIV